MGLYTCFLPKERVCAKKDVLLWCLICAKYLFYTWQSDLYLKLFDFRPTLAHPSIKDMFIQTHIVPGKLLSIHKFTA